MGNITEVKYGTSKRKPNNDNVLFGEIEILRAELTAKNKI